MAEEPEKPLDTELLELIEDCLQRTGMTPTEFGRRSINDPVLIRDLKARRELRFTTRQRVLNFIENQTAPEPPEAI